MSTKPTVRCKATNLTKPQVEAISSVLLGGRTRADPLPHGVWRSLVMRGVLTPNHALTERGQKLFEQCRLLSDKIKTVLLAKRAERQVLARAVRTQLREVEIAK